MSYIRDDLNCAVERMIGGEKKTQLCQQRQEFLLARCGSGSRKRKKVYLLLSDMVRRLSFL